MCEGRVEHFVPGPMARSWCRLNATSRWSGRVVQQAETRVEGAWFQRLKRKDYTAKETNLDYFN